MTRVLVTGASGFLGGNLARYLAERGHQVRYLARGKKVCVAAAGLDNVERCEGDMNDAAALVLACAGVEWVFHVAALVSMLERDRKDMERVNVGGTELLLAAAEKAGVKRFILVSTVDTVGVRPDGKPADEATPYNMDQFHNPYPDTKKAQEDVVLRAAKDRLDCVVVNPGFMIGAFDTKPSSSRMVLEIMRGRGLVYSKGGNSFVDVRDVCAGTLLAAEKGKRGGRYILAGHNLTYREFFTRTAGLVGRRPPWFALPQIIAETAGLLFEWWANLTKGEALVTRAEVVLGGLDHYFDSSKAQRELGYSVSPIEGAIERARDWFLAQRKKSGALGTTLPASENSSTR